MVLPRPVTLQLCPGRPVGSSGGVGKGVDAQLLRQRPLHGGAHRFIEGVLRAEPSRDLAEPPEGRSAGGRG